MSTGAVEAFPIIKTLEKIGGRVQCAAWGFGLGSIRCLLFCFCLFGDYYFGGAQMIDLIGTVEDGDNRIGVQVNTNNGRCLPEQQHDSMQQQVQSRQRNLACVQCALKLPPMGLA